MLNFIVLGQVPGTNFELTFQWVLLLALLLALSTLVIVEQPRLRAVIKTHKPESSDPVTQSA